MRRPFLGLHCPLHPMRRPFLGMQCPLRPMRRPFLRMQCPLRPIQRPFLAMLHALAAALREREDALHEESHGHHALHRVPNPLRGRERECVGSSSERATTRHARVGMPGEPLEIPNEGHAMPTTRSRRSRKHATSLQRFALVDLAPFTQGARSHRTRARASSARAVKIQSEMPTRAWQQREIHCRTPL
jgi:hypothetical protein